MVISTPTFNRIPKPELISSLLAIFCTCLFVFLLTNCLLQPKLAERKYEGYTFLGDFLVENSEHVSYENIPVAPCANETWNQVSMVSVPYFEQFRKWAKDEPIFPKNNEDLRLIAAFLYNDSIAVTTSYLKSDSVGQPIQCRYYDCNRVEIPSTIFNSFIFPITSVYCARRTNAKYISLSFNPTDIPPEPIPLNIRLFEGPVNEVGVCVDPIYGGEPKWLEIIEFVEHHRIMGATMFYFTIFEIDDYSKKVVEDYENLGLADVTYVNMEHGDLSMYQMIQLSQCHFRSQYHSKWIINIELSERLVMTKMPLLSYLRSIDPPICEISFSSRRVLKTKPNPAKYENDDKLINDLQIHQYNLTSTAIWDDLRIIARPDRVFGLSTNWYWRLKDGCEITYVMKDIGYIRRYQSTTKAELGVKWITEYKPYYISRQDPRFEEMLTKAVVNRVKYLYHNN